MKLLNSTDEPKNHFNNLRVSLVAQTVKNPPAMQETWFQSLGWEDALGKGTGYPSQLEREGCGETTYM